MLEYKEKILRYFHYLIENSTAQAPLWNVEQIRQKSKSKWNYIDGCMLKAICEMYRYTGDERYYEFVKNFMDYYVFEDGSIRTYDKNELNIDNINAGKNLFFMYDKTGDEKYKRALDLIRSQLDIMPRTKGGNFWHKKIYENQVWLDGLYMAQPFYMEYEARFRKMSGCMDSIHQFENVEKFMKDKKTGLYYHGYDESRSMYWADKDTGLSENFWLRSIGWFAASLVDTAEVIPETLYYEYRYLQSLLKNLIDAMMPYQDPTGMFYQLVNRPEDEGNYLETSGTALIAYSILRGVRLGYLPRSYRQYGEKAFTGIVKQFLRDNGDGSLSLSNICLVAGLGGASRRDGSAAYYYSEPIVENDAKGVAPFLLAFTEILRDETNTVEYPAQVQPREDSSPKADFRVVSIFNRAIAIEMANDSCFAAEKSFTVYVNGEPYVTTQKNVVSIFGLTPNTEYEIAVEYESESAHHTVRTEKESALLNVMDFGASGDGVSEDTLQIQAAISACPKGGTVYLPKGVYYVRPLFLKSDITVLLEEDAVLLGALEREKYPILPGVIRDENDFSKEMNYGTWEGNPLDCYASLITGIGVENTAIIGKGTIDGNAEKGPWWVEPKMRHGAWRPRTIFVSQCRNFRMLGVTVQNSPAWTIHPYRSDDLWFVDLYIKNPYDSPNTDGFDPESCENVYLLGTEISVGDDCVAIKSGKYYTGRHAYKTSRNIVVRNCRLERGHGSVTIGSEVSCGVSEVEVSQCIFRETDRGVRLKTRRGRGNRSVLEKLSFHNIQMENVDMPIVCGMFYFCDPDGHSDYVQSQSYMEADERTPAIRDIHISDLTCTGVNQSFACMYGLPESKISSVSIENAQVSFREKAKRESLSPVMMDGFEPLSGKSFYLRNIAQVSLKHIAILGSEDTEPEMIDVDQTEKKDLEYHL